MDPTVVNSKTTPEPTTPAPAGPGSGARTRARRAARALRHTPDRLLHGVRRRRALARLRAERPVNVVFVCLGNICRSPYAAHAFRRGAGSEELQVTSCGMIGPGRPVPAEGQAEARRRGLDLAEHRSQLMTSELLRHAELVVVMDARQRRTVVGRGVPASRVLILGDLDPSPIDTRTIRDPYGQAQSVFGDVYARIDRCVNALVRALPPAES
jgi:protein-tyrosine-phosphatase